MLPVPNVEVPNAALVFDNFAFVKPFCIGHGHLPSECFGAGKKYDLLPEDDG
jgi:hypothetical protein